MPIFRLKNDVSIIQKNDDATVNITSAFSQAISEYEKLDETEFQGGKPFIHSFQLELSDKGKKFPFDYFVFYFLPV